MYNNLGPGLLESAYETALKIELEKEGLLVESQVYLPIVYGDVTIPKAYRIDILVEKKVIIELKAVQYVNEVFYKQLQTYLKMTGLKLGILVNFDTTDIASSIHRWVNGL